MSDFASDAASAARKAGMVVGGKAGLAASSAALGFFTFAAPPLVVIFALPAAGAWLGWKAADKATSWLEPQDPTEDHSK